MIHSDSKLARFPRVEVFLDPSLNILGCCDMAGPLLVEDTLRSSTQYLTAIRREETTEHRAKTFHGLVLRGQLRTAVR